MDELFMQIEIYEEKLNRKTSYDNIVKIKEHNQFLYIEDIDGWSIYLKMSEDIVITIQFSDIV